MINLDRIQIGEKLADLTLAVKPGEAVVIVGSRGSGKSTLMRMLAGQELATGGSATIGGIDVRLPASRALVGLVGESWGFFERLTVRENLALMASAWGLGSDRVESVMKRLDLGGRAQARVGQLSAGEMARLSLARALLHDPQALLLDEPAGDIDGESASLIAFTIAEEVEAGKAVLITTFGYPRILQLATRLCYLEGGRLAEPEREPAPAPAPAPKPAPAAVEQAPSAAPPVAAPGGQALGRIPHVAARKGERVLLFRPEEIRYAYAQEKAVFIQTGEGACGVSFTLTDLEERLADQDFFRCHRAYLVNVAWVKEIASWTRDSFSLILKDGTDLPLSKHRAHELRLRLGW